MFQRFGERRGDCESEQESGAKFFKQSANESVRVNANKAVFPFPTVNRVAYFISTRAKKVELRMTQWQAIAQIMTSAVALMGALVAGLSVYFTYRGRHNQFRQVVYGRQMDAYFDITEAMSHLFSAAQDTLAVTNPLLRDEDARDRFKSTLREEHESFAKTVNRSLIVLPSKVKAAVDGFNEMLLAISDPDEEFVAGRTDDPGKELGQAYERAVNCIRYHLAIDSLTSGMLKEMGIGSESVAMKRFRSGVNPLVPVGRSHH